MWVVVFVWVVVAGESLSSVGEMFPWVLDKAGNSVLRASDSRQVSLTENRGWVRQVRRGILTVSWLLKGCFLPSFPPSYQLVKGEVHSSSTEASRGDVPGLEKPMLCLFYPLGTQRSSRS